MRLSIISKHPQFMNRELRQYSIDGKAYVGAWGDEPYAIQVFNDSLHLIEARVSIDGTDILTGQPATREPSGKRWAVRSRQSMSLEAWPESERGGARFIFTQPDRSVAQHVRGDVSDMGTIAVAIFTEGYAPPPTMRRSYSYGDFHGTCGERIKGGAGTLRGAAGTGAGGYVSQQIATSEGLRRPRLDRVIHVHYAHHRNAVSWSQNRILQ